MYKNSGQKGKPLSSYWEYPEGSMELSWHGFPTLEETATCELVCNHGDSDASKDSWYLSSVIKNDMPS